VETAFHILSSIKDCKLEPINQMFSLYVLFQNPIFATLYLSTPYLFMLLLDIDLKKKHREDAEFEKIKTIYKEQAAVQQNKNSANNQ